MTTTTLALTREQIKALRAADTVVARWQEAEPETHVLDLSKEVERGDGFGRETLHVRLPAPAHVTNDGQGFISQDADSVLPRAIAGDWVLLSLSVRPEWQTFAHFVRAGDELRQEWAVDNRNVVIARAGVTMHELKLRIHRPQKDGRVRVYTFMLDAHAELGNGYSSCVTRERT